MRGQDISEGRAFQIEGTAGAKALVQQGGHYDQDVSIHHPELLYQTTLSLKSSGVSQGSLCHTVARYEGDYKNLEVTMLPSLELVPFTDTTGTKKLNVA